MRKDELRDAFDGIDESIVEKFIREDERIIKHKKESRRKRTLAIIKRTVAACLCLCIAAGSGFIIRNSLLPSETAPHESTSSPDSAPTSSGADNKEGLFDMSLFSEKYSGRSVNILCWDSEHQEFEATANEVIGSNDINEAIFERNKKVSEALGIKLAFNVQDDDSGKKATILAYVERCESSGEPLDVIALYSRTSALLAQKGHLLPLNYYHDYINLSNPWYPESIKKDTDIGGNTYYVTGDISTNTLYLMVGFIFNKDLTDKNNDIGYTSDSLYTLVKEQKWTLEEMYKLVGSYWNDLDANGKKTEADGVGLRTYTYHLESVYFGAGLSMVSINSSPPSADKLITLSSDYSGSKAIEIADALGKIMTSNSGYNDSSAAVHFSLGNDISMILRIRDIEKLLLSESSNLRYGLLPIPKYDTEQKNYITTPGIPFTQWGISSSSRDYDREVISAAIIEAMGYFAQSTTSPTVFDTLFPETEIEENNTQARKNDRESFNVMKRTISLDVGRMFIFPSNFGLYNDWATSAAKRQNWAAVSKSLDPLLSQSLKGPSKDFYGLSQSFKPTK